MLLEPWIMKLLENIKAAVERGENYDLHLEYPAVDEIAQAYEQTTSIEIFKVRKD